MQQEREDAYERALEQRREELAALQASAATADAPAADLPEALGESALDLQSQHSGSTGSTEGRQPGTPDPHGDQAATTIAATTPAAPGMTAGRAAAAGSTGNSLVQQQQQQAVASGSLSGGPLDIPPLGSAGSSLFGSATAGNGSSMFGSPSMATGLGASQDAFPSSMSGSPFPKATVGAGLTGAACPNPFAAAPGMARFATHSPPGSVAPFSSPAAQQGLPPLPGGRQQSLGAALAAAMAHPNGSSGGAMAAAVPSLTSTHDTDQMLSMRLQDALFVGSPAATTRQGQASPQAAAARRASLFAALGACEAEVDGDADSNHLLSSSLSCLDDGCGDGVGLLVRSMSSFSAGSGLLEAAAAVDALRFPSSGDGSPGGRGDAASDGSGSSGMRGADGSNSDEVRLGWGCSFGCAWRKAGCCLLRSRPLAFRWVAF